VTSTSLMVRWSAATEAAQFAKAHPALSVGLHFDIGEWTWANGEWIALYEVVQKDDREAVATELSRQVEAFCEMVGRKPTHIDSHQHVHRRDPVRAVIIEKAEQLEIPLRLHSKIRYCGGFYGQMEHGEPLPGLITVEALDALFSTLEPGISELGCHPARYVQVDTMYKSERVLELNVLCDQRVRSLLAEREIGLCSFNNLPKDQWA
jgi:predicted glycoside hydrolase/deacetylase ChbG (UPF0249 family)